MKPLFLILFLSGFIFEESKAHCGSGKFFGVISWMSCDSVGIPNENDSPADNVCDTPTKIHPNGGGRVAVIAHVEPTVFVDKHSRVCGSSRLVGETSIINSTIFNSQIDSSVIRETQVTNSEINIGSIDKSVVTASKLAHSLVSRSTILKSNFASKNLDGDTAVENLTY